MKEIKKQIKEKSFYKVYLLTGDEPYLILQAKHMLKNGMIREGDTMNYAEFTDAKVDINTLQELAFTYPFFSEKRLLLLDGTGILKTGKDEFVNIMDNMPETTCILICESEVDKRSKVYKWIKKNGYIGEFLKKNQTEKVLLRWIAALLGKEKKQIRENDAIYFLQKVGDDMFQIKNETDMEMAAKRIGDTYHCAVLCKGGHRVSDANDLLYWEQGYEWFRGRRIENPNTHGTGCTLSSAIASNLAKGQDLKSAVLDAKEYISGALAAMLDLGKGSGPMDHGWKLNG